jgi:hypothetical protein
MPTDLYIEDQRELRIVQEPNSLLQLRALILVVAILVWIANLATQINIVSLVFIPIFLVFVASQIFPDQKRQCIINLKDRSIHLSVTGILQSPIGKSEHQHSIEEITSIEMIRHITKIGKGSFSIKLTLKNSQYLVLSNNDLTFQDCQDYASQIQKFVGTHIPIVAVG